MSTFRVRLTQGDSRTGGGNLDSQGLRTGTVTDATNATPIVVTSASHGLTSGMRVTISGVAGNEAANGDFTITVISSSTFSLNGSTGDGSYTSGGVWRVDSVQRTMYAMGPNKINRKLKDGEVFTDCNYWKRFTYPTLPYNQAFIETVEDDGSVYVDGEVSTFIRTYSRTIATSTTHTDTNNIFDILGDNGGPAVFTSITVTGDEVTVRVNDVSTSDFSVAASTTHTFNTGDVLINKITIDNSESGAATAVVTIQCGIRSSCNS